LFLKLFCLSEKKPRKLTFSNSAVDPLKLLCAGGGQPYSFLPEPVAVTFNHQRDSPREELNAAYMTGGTPFVKFTSIAEEDWWFMHWICVRAEHLN